MMHNVCQLAQTYLDTLTHTKKSLFHRQFSRSFRIVTNERRHPRDVIDLAAAVQEGQLHDDEALDDVSAAQLDQLDGCAESSSGR